MKTRRFDFNFRPLQLEISLVAEGSVPARQDYDADIGEHTPDYTITPLTLQPHVGIIDKDEILPSGSVNAKLTNIKWYELIGGVRTLITAENSNYVITTTGLTAGRILVQRNILPSTPLTLIFEAQYTDTRTSQIHTVGQTFLVVCKNSTKAIPVLSLDTAEQTIYDPFIHPATRVVTASLREDTKEVDAANRIFVWEKFRENGAWTEVGSDSVMDYDVVVAEDGNSATVNMELMGEELALRCRAKYSPVGEPSSVTLSDSSPSKIVKFVRRPHKYECDFCGVPYNIPHGTPIIYPEAVVTDSNGKISNAEDVIIPLWHAGTNNSAGNPSSYSLVAHGMNPEIPTTKMNQTYGMVLGVEAKDRGAWAAAADSDGSVFVDSDGKVFVFH